MEHRSASQITQLLRAWNGGDQAALEQLTPLLYDELHRLARGYMRGERAGHMLQTTALINEAYLRLLDWPQVEWQDRAHILGLAAQMMRRVLIDFARASACQARRSGAASRIRRSPTRRARPRRRVAGLG